MKNTPEQPLFAEERQEQILNMLNRTNKLMVSDLCEFFQVSTATIRNDLRDLAAQGLLKRTHGGAIPIGQASFEPTSADKEVFALDEKQRIAAAAAELVSDGDTLAIDAGTTLLEFAKALINKNNLTIVTNDLRIASYLEANTEHTTIILAGVIRHGLQCSVGPLALATLESINVDKLFLATNAFHPKKGFSTPDLNQAEVKKAFIRSAAETIVLCDSSKLSKVSFIEFAQLRDIDKLITDKNISPQMKSYFDEQGDLIEVSYV